MSELQPGKGVSAGEVVDQVDALARRLIAAEHDAGDHPPREFLEAVERRGQLRRARRWLPISCVAAAAMIGLMGMMLMVRFGAVAQPAKSVVVDDAQNNAAAPTAANLRTLNRDVTSPEGLRLAGSGARPVDGTHDARPETLSPRDARGADRIDKIMDEK